jgi:hypothetical protein
VGVRNRWARRRRACCAGERAGHVALVRADDADREGDGAPSKLYRLSPIHIFIHIEKFKLKKWLI